jgi:hypothetical protein
MGPTSTTTLGSLLDHTEGSHATSRGPGSGSTLPSGLPNIIHRMLPTDQARALHLLQQMGPATGNFTPYLLPFCSTTEAAALTAQIPIEILVAVGAATTVQNQQVAEFTTASSSEAHAATISVGATEEEAAPAAQATSGAALTSAQAAIAEADATTSTG